jgi:hypothetical protein
MVATRGKLLTPILITMHTVGRYRELVSDNNTSYTRSYFVTENIVAQFGYVFFHTKAL